MSDAVSPSFYRALIHPRGVYSLTLGTVLGSSLWHSFIGGPVAYGALPRMQFGHLQSALFPKFFALQSTASFVLLGLYGKTRSLTSKALWRNDRNLWLLAVMAVSGVANWAVVGPWTTAVMKRRHRKERLEGKDYSDPAASDEMKLLNRKFAKLHGVSSLINLAFLLAAVAHTAHIGTFGALPALA
ncbi:hypothetical protein JCM11251_004142 [Rhodosporidiobolus azoricus]